jgi:hypothetical protein
MFGKLSQPFRYQSERPVGSASASIKEATSQLPRANTIAHERPTSPVPITATRGIPELPRSFRNATQRKVILQSCDAIVAVP